MPLNYTDILANLHHTFLTGNVNHLIYVQNLIAFNQQLDHIFFVFQLASSTLDASAKIYAGRVDAIHSDAYKVLTGLGRSNVAMPKDNGKIPSTC
jgi:hypothetical protein